MYDFLKMLGDDGILTPLSAMVTGFFAFLAVFINNSFLRSNLKKQIDAQAVENQKQRNETSRLAAVREKKEKLGELSENIHKYMVELEECESLSKKISGSWDASSKTSIDNLRDLREKFTVGQLYISKAELIALAYSDRINTVFELIRSREKVILEHIELLIFFELSIGDRKQHEDTDAEKLERVHLNEKLVKSYFSNGKAYKEIRHFLSDVNREVVAEVKAVN